MHYHGGTGWCSTLPLLPYYHRGTGWCSTLLLHLYTNEELADVVHTYYFCIRQSKGLLQASVTVRKFGVITKYTEICIAGNPLNYFFESNLEGDTHQFTTAPLHNEAMATIIADEPW